MPQGRVHHSALTVRVAPSQGIVVVVAIALGQIDRVIVQAHQYMGFTAIPALDGIDLVIHPELVPQGACRRVVGIFDDNVDFLRPGMAREIATEHLAIFGPIIPAPFTVPAIVTVLPDMSSCAKDFLGRVSVVIIAFAKSRPDEAELESLCTAFEIPF